MSVKSAKVALVLDASYGSRLYALVKEMSVWTMDSPVNTDVAKDIWTQKPQPEHMVTTFKRDTFEGLMDNIELHHGHYSHTPPFQDLVVIGLTLDPKLQQVLRDYDFGSAAATKDGFVASRAPNACPAHGEPS